MLPFILGLIVGSFFAFIVFCLFACRRIVPTPIEAEEPMPCIRNIPQETIRDWFAKLDEEVTEFKAEILRSADEAQKHVNQHNAERGRL